MRFPRPDRFVAAMFRSLALGLRGNRILVRPEVREARLVECEACPHFDQTIRQCNLCTCLVDFKAELSAEFCPDGRWSVIRLTKSKFYAFVLKLWPKT